MSGGTADADLIERLSTESQKFLQEGRVSYAFSPGRSQWIHLFLVHSTRFMGTVAVWEDRHFEEERRLEIKSMAHDINNLLAVTQGHLELMQRAIGEETSASLNEALWMLERAEDLIHRMGSLSNEERILRDGQTLVEETLQHLTAGLNQVRYQVKLDVEANLPLVPLTRADFIEIFHNIIQNACESMPDGGIIMVQAKRNGDQVAIQVRDSGSGICSEHIDVIFSPYFTTKPTGHGLGLHRTRQLVEQYGGRIQVMSTPGSGSNFLVTLPGAAETSSASDVEFR